MKHPQVVLDGLTKPTLIYTLHNPYVPNPLSVRVIDKIKNLVPQVECCIFGATPILRDCTIDRNSVVVFDAGSFFNPDSFKFLVLGQKVRVPEDTKKWSFTPHKKEDAGEDEREPLSQWGVAIGSDCSAARIINCASMIAAHFIVNFSIEEIERGNYPWGPRKTAKRKPRRNVGRSYDPPSCYGFYDHQLGL